MPKKTMKQEISRTNKYRSLPLFQFISFFDFPNIISPWLLRVRSRGYECSCTCMLHISKWPISVTEIQSKVYGASV